MTNPPPPQTPGWSGPQPPPPGAYPPSAPGYAPAGPPPKKGTSKALVGLLACGGLFVGLVIIGAIIAAVAPKTDTTTNTIGVGGAGDGGTNNGGSDAGTSRVAPAPVGTEISPAKGWALTVTGPATDATADILKANQFNAPKVPTHKLYAVPVKVTNGSGEPGAPFVELKIGALPPDGVRVDSAFAVVGYPTVDLTSQLQPGASLSGAMVFELDPAAVGETVLLAEPQFTLDENADQRFLSIK